MAQRTARDLWLCCSGSATFGSLESEERVAVPACTRNGKCDCAQGWKHLAFIFESIRADFHLVQGASVAPLQRSSDCRQAPISLRPLNGEGMKLPGWAGPQIGVPCQQQRSIASAFGQVPFGKCLHAPGDPSKQELPVHC